MGPFRGFYSGETGKFYKLRETKDWPTLEISGIHMHRMGRVSPKEDTQNKVNCLSPKGRVLDTCMGLGYTAIMMASMEVVKEVITVEKDRNVVEIAKQNPFSAGLWKNPKIRIVEGDVFSEIGKLGKFDAILHDPPRLALAGELYSLEFYRKLFSALKPGGRMFHYTGSPGVKRGKNIPAGVKKRLVKAGFRIVKDCPEALGILAERKKPF